MDLIREKVFVNRYHYDVRNHEWEKENGVPKTNVEVTFQLHNKDEAKDFSQEEAEALAAPLLDTLQRLTYEVTEIALDRPGINLEF